MIAGIDHAMSPVDETTTAVSLSNSVDDLSSSTLQQQCQLPGIGLISKSTFGCILVSECVIRFRVVSSKRHLAGRGGLAVRASIEKTQF